MLYQYWGSSLKIYTGFGDKGKTRLLGGQVIDKDNLRVESYGTIDEINSVLGLLVTYLSDPALVKDIQNVQNLLFEISGELTNPQKKDDNITPPAIYDNDIKNLESKIDTMEEQLDPLKNFILPGGSREVSIIHMARTICRRAERNVISLNRDETINPEILVFLNRLSDYFFVLARYLNKINGIKDIPWITRQKL